jgi:hypothetical protein
MGGVFYAFAILAVWVVIRWYVVNDAVPLDKPTTGLLAMRDQETMKIREHTRRKFSPFKRHGQ